MESEKKQRRDHKQDSITEYPARRRDRPIPITADLFREDRIARPDKRGKQ